MTTEPKRRTRKAATRETTATPQSTRRKAAEFSVPIKLWVSQEMYDALHAAAEQREWSVPQVIRRVVRAAMGERKLD